jgi:SAM-dependent methyltransferase
MQIDTTTRTNATLGLPQADPAAESRFHELLLAAGMEPSDPFGGGYVMWEWDHSRHLFNELPISLAGARVLELGCHLGATAVVLALLGAEVTAVDVDPSYLDLARANAERFGVSSRVTVAHVNDTRQLPFENRSFDLVSCNSVLEYVPHAQLPAVLGEVARVLRRKGLLVVVGTSSRLWPRERHSGRWLSNYVPRFVDGWWPGRPLRRGLSAREIQAALPGFTDLLAEEPERLIRFKRHLGISPSKLAVFGAGAQLAGLMGISLGTLLPTLTMVLQGPGRRWAAGADPGGD